MTQHVNSGRSSFSQQFVDFLCASQRGDYRTPRDVPVSVFALADWELLNREDAERIFLPFLRHNIEGCPFPKAHGMVNSGDGPDSIA